MAEPTRQTKANPRSTKTAEREDAKQSGAGQTDLTWDQLGRVRHATISLALQSTAGAPLSDAALLSVAVHETGHAIGLPHSPDSNDIMFPSTRTSALSERDVRTAQMLYQLPPGSVKDSADR